MTSIEPGRLRHRIAIQAASTTPDAFGQPQQTWTTIWNCWASIEPLSARELYGSGSLAAQAMHKITIRYTAQVALKAGMRAVFFAHAYRIQGFLNSGLENTLVTVTALEVNGGQ